MGRAMEKDWAELWRKTGQRGLLIAGYKRLQKRLRQSHKSCHGSSLCPCTLGTTRVSASQEAAPTSCSTLTVAELPQAIIVLCPCAQGHFGSVRLCHPADCGLPGFSVREGVAQARTLEHMGQYWLPYPSAAAAAAAKSLQSCPTLCDPRDGSPPGSPIHTLLEHYISCCPSRQLP